MRCFIFILLLINLTVFANKDISFSYFQAQYGEAQEDRKITKVYCDPNKKDKVFYISYDRVYRSDDGSWNNILDLSELDSDNDDDNNQKEKLEQALKELYDEIYQEEIDAIEDEYGVDDAESTFEDLLKERTDDRFEDESQSLKENFKYSDNMEKIKSGVVTPIKSLTFLQNLSTHILIDTHDGFYISTDGGDSFAHQSSESINSIDFETLSFTKTEILFTSEDKLYIFDGESKTVSLIDFTEYNDQRVLQVDSFFPYLMVQTDQNIYLLKQERDHLIKVTKVRYTYRNDLEYNIFYFGGKDLFLLEGSTIYIFHVLTGERNRVNLSQYNIHDIKYRDEVIYLGTNMGMVALDFTKRKKDEITLGLLPEQVYHLSISSDKKIYVTNFYDIYTLKEFKSLKELSKDRNVFAVMKTVSKKYPPINQLIESSYRYHFIQKGIYSNMLTRNGIAPFMPVIKLRYRHPLVRSDDKDAAFNYIQGGYTTKSPYFEGFVYFDLSSWIFDIKDMRAHRLNNEKSALKEIITAQITYLYSIRQIMEVLYILTENIKQKMVFKLKMEEHGALLNGLTGKKFF